MDDQQHARYERKLYLFPQRKCRVHFLLSTVPGTIELGLRYAVSMFRFDTGDTGPRSLSRGERTVPAHGGSRGGPAPRGWIRIH
jgi:hypothetical protein